MVNTKAAWAAYFAHESVLKEAVFWGLEFNRSYINQGPDLAHAMWLEPGDLQIINSHVTLHSRTDFIDHDDPAQKRLLFRLWLAPPDGDRLPESWRILSHTASLILSVTKLRLVSGLLVAETSTRMVRVASNQSVHGTA